MRLARITTRRWMVVIAVVGDSRALTLRLRSDCVRAQAIKYAELEAARAIAAVHLEIMAKDLEQTPDPPLKRLLGLGMFTNRDHATKWRTEAANWRVEEETNGELDRCFSGQSRALGSSRRLSRPIRLMSRNRGRL
jgi:hypothetical protein